MSSGVEVVEWSGRGRIEVWRLCMWMGTDGHVSCTHRHRHYVGCLLLCDICARAGRCRPSRALPGAACAAIFLKIPFFIADAVYRRVI